MTNDNSPAKSEPSSEESWTIKNGTLGLKRLSVLNMAINVHETKFTHHQKILGFFHIMGPNNASL